MDLTGLIRQQPRQQPRLIAVIYLVAMPPGSVCMYMIFSSSVTIIVISVTNATPIRRDVYHAIEAAAVSNGGIELQSWFFWLYA